MTTKVIKQEENREKKPLPTLQELNNAYTELCKKYKTTSSTTIPYQLQTATQQTVYDNITYLLKLKSLKDNTQNRIAIRATMAALVQLGATVPKTGASLRYDGYGVEINAVELREACKASGIQVRKLARARGFCPLDKFLIKICSHKMLYE